jgi:hypothetical protein
LTFDIVLGIVLTILTLGVVVLLTLWSRRIIERIHAHRPSSMRNIQKEILNEQNPRPQP